MSDDMQESFRVARDQIDTTFITAMNAVLDDVRAQLAASALPDDVYTLVTTLELYEGVPEIAKYTEQQQETILSVNALYLQKWNDLESKRQNAISRAFEDIVKQHGYN